MLIYYLLKIIFIYSVERGRPRTARPGTSHGRPYTFYLNKIQLKVYQGDITTAGVDVIVNSCNTECDLSKGLFCLTF